MALVLLKLTSAPLAISFDMDIRLDQKKRICNTSSISIILVTPLIVVLKLMLSLPAISNMDPIDRPVSSYSSGV